MKQGYVFQVADGVKFKDNPISGASREHRGFIVNFMASGHARVRTNQGLYYIIATDRLELTAD